MMDNGSPRVVFFYLNKDKSVRQRGVGDVVGTPDGDMLFTMVCPKCLERGESHGSSQVMVKNSHRKWGIDTRSQGKTVQLLDPDGVPFYVKVCGAIWVNDIVKCSNVNCTWAVRIGVDKERPGITLVEEA